MSIRSMLAFGAAASLASLALAGCAHKPAPAPAKTASAPPPAAAPYTPPPAPAQAAQTGPVPGSVADFLAQTQDRVYFDYDQAGIRTDAKPALDAQAAWLDRYPSVKVQIDGNADERGTREYNMALGAKRAQEVREYLVAHGVAPARISTISYGKERPIDLGQNDQAFAHNRNGHTAITGGAS